MIKTPIITAVWASSVSVAATAATDGMYAGLSVGKDSSRGTYSTDFHSSWASRQSKDKRPAAE